MTISGKSVMQRCPACGAQIENMSEHLESAHPEDTSQMEEGQDQRSLATGSRPWGVRTLLFVSMFVGVGAAGTVAAFNWRRLGRPDLFVPTLLVAGGSMLAVDFFILGGLSLISSQIQPVSLLINAAAAGAFWLWQKSADEWWIMNHPEPGRAGVGIPLLVSVAWILIRSALALF